jgi:hypothetical protein
VGPVDEVIEVLRRVLEEDGRAAIGLHRTRGDEALADRGILSVPAGILDAGPRLLIIGPREH